MQAAQVLAGYSLGGADLLRRAMGKKIKAEMDAQRATFVEGCATHNGIGEAYANQLFDLIDKFAGYGFNKSHAAAYALLAYQTAWLKAHYREEFFAASMCFDMHQTDKLCIFIDDMKRLGVTCLPPDLNASEAEFSVEPNGDDHAVRYGLGALKGVGEKAMEDIVAEREANGRFTSLDDLAKRVDPRALNKRQVETLAAAGAFDSIDKNRAGVFAAAEMLLAEASRHRVSEASGQGDFLSAVTEHRVHVEVPASAHWSLAKAIEAEKEAFGFFFSSHPLDRYAHLARGQGARPIAALGEVAVAEGGRAGARIAALVEDARWRTSARGNRYLMMTLSDQSGQIPATCFDEDTARNLEEAAREGGCGLMTVELDRRAGEDSARVTVRRIEPLEALAQSSRMSLTLDVVDAGAWPALAAVFAPTRGGRGEVRARVRLPAGGEATLVVGRDFRIDPELATTVGRVAGVQNALLSAEPALALAG